MNDANPAALKVPPANQPPWPAHPAPVEHPEALPVARAKRAGAKKAEEKKNRRLSIRPPSLIAIGGLVAGALLSAVPILYAARNRKPAPATTKRHRAKSKHRRAAHA